MTDQLPDKTAPDSALALVGVSVCEVSAKLHSWSLALCLFASLAGLALLVGSDYNPILTCLVPILAAASCQVYFAMRLAFDRPVFAAWARLPDDGQKEAQRAFDMALGMLLKKNIPAERDRAMLDRVMGTRRLLLCQIVAILIQMLFLLGLLILLF
ncbi:MAG: hypothetical protein LBQ75_02890 [Zoogloeaceae bacterium]|jgi:hypothetical protein|nr:hypothetical protein [Zoogloeaceae bacterium]